MKYLNRFRTKREAIAAIKSAEPNALFFSRDTMRFFGPQKFDVFMKDDQLVFEIEFERRRHIALFSVNPDTLKLRRMP